VNIIRSFILDFKLYEGENGMNLSGYRKYKKIFLLILIGLSVFFVNAWTLRENFYFLFDDIAWIKEVKFDFDIKNFFTLLPAWRYNDRPIRTFFFWILYQLFGLDYTKYYFVTIIWHIVNTYLLLQVAYLVLKESNFEKAFECACVCASFFGVYPKNLMAVYWISGAANDLLCTFFSMLTILFYLHYMKNRKSYFCILGALFTYILAMRSKEAPICLPIIIMLYEFYIAYLQKRKKKIYLGNITLILYMMAYVIRIFTLPAGLTAAGQYEQDFSPITIFNVLLNYIRMYFGLDDGSFTYRLNEYYTTRIGDIGLIIITVIVAVTIVKMYYEKSVERGWGVILLIVMIGFSIAPLLILPNIQHLLYFYFPAIFLSLLFGILIFQGLDFLRVKTRMGRFISPALFTLIISVLLNFTGGAWILRNFWIACGEDALSASKDIHGIDTLPDESHLLGNCETSSQF